MLHGLPPFPSECSGPRTTPLRPSHARHYCRGWGEGARGISGRQHNVTLNPRGVQGVAHVAAQQALLSASPTLPPPPPRGGCLPFSKWWVPPSDGTPPPPGAKSGLVVLRGRTIFLALEAPVNLFPYIFPRVGQSVSGWVPLELTPPPPPPVGVGHVLWVPAKSGCIPFSFCPPPPPPPPHPPVFFFFF